MSTKTSSTVMSKQEKRIQSKKRKIQALLNIARLNDKDRDNGIKAKKQKSNNETTANSDGEVEKTVQNSNDLTEDQDKIKKVKNQEEAASNEDIEQLKAEYRERRKLTMELPKIFLTLENIKHPFYQKMQEAEEPFTPSVDFQPVLYMTDLQHLLLYALQGNKAAYKPRWCKLLRHQKVRHVMVIVVDDLSTTEFSQYPDCFPYLQENFPDNVEMSCPSQYGSTVQRDLFTVPLSITKLITHKNLSRREAKKVKQSEEKWPMFVESKDKKLPSCDEAIEHDENFSRVDLLLNAEQMVQENYPLPVCNDMYKDYVYSNHKYSDVSRNSPMFAIDCEMCLSFENKLVLTSIGVIDEYLNIVYQTLVKPDVPIKNYLTKFSGITKKMLSNVTTSLQDVQKKLQTLLPADAILCGQSLNGDLHAIKMFHPYVIDTSVIYNLSGLRRIKPGLKKLTAQFLKRDIQDNPSGHDAVEDAIATMELVNLKLTEGIDFGDVTLGGRLHASKTPQYSSNTTEQSRDTEGQISKNAFFQRSDPRLYDSFFNVSKERKKKVVLVGRENDIQLYKTETDTILAETDKLIVKQMTTCHWNYDMTYSNLNGFACCVKDNASEDVIKNKLQKLDKRIRKMTKCLPKGSLVVVVFSGRTNNGEIHNAKCFVKVTM